MRLKDFRNLLSRDKETDRVTPTQTPTQKDEVKEEMTILDDLFDTYTQYEDYEDDFFEDEDDDFYDDFGREVSNPIPSNRSITIKASNIADGATTLTEMSDMLRIYADFLDSLDEDGFTLMNPIVSGSGYAVPAENTTNAIGGWGV